MDLSKAPARLLNENLFKRLDIAYLLDLTAALPFTSEQVYSMSSEEFYALIKEKTRKVRETLPDDAKTGFLFSAYNGHKNGLPKVTSTDPNAKITRVPAYLADDKELDALRKQELREFSKF